MTLHLQSLHKILLSKPRLSPLSSVAFKGRAILGGMVPCPTFLVALRKYRQTHTTELCPQVHMHKSPGSRWDLYLSTYFILVRCWSILQVPVNQKIGPLNYLLPALWDHPLKVGLIKNRFQEYIKTQLIVVEDAKFQMTASFDFLSLFFISFVCYLKKLWWCDTAELLNQQFPC